MCPAVADMRVFLRSRIVSLALILTAVGLVGSVFPVVRVTRELGTRLDALGDSGHLVYGLAYVIGSLLLVPGSALTVGAGAAFGLVPGTIVVSLSSVTAAALAFLLGRSLFRSKVEALAARYGKFRAIDRAIEARGPWIVALLRLSPVIPFGPSNYLYGLSSVRFWPYVFASWAAMLPGTLLYGYLGSAGRDVVAGVDGRPTGEWVFLAVGFVATFLGTAWITKMARRAVRIHTATCDSPEEMDS